MIAGLERILNAEPDLQFAGACDNFNDGIDIVRNQQPNIVLIDQTVGLKPALQFIADLKSLVPASKPVLWAHELADVECFRVLQLGARGVLRKTMPVASLLDCLRSVAQGAVWLDGSSEGEMPGLAAKRAAPRLTPRERDIVRCVCQGMKNKEIAGTLSITPGTVKVHLMHIFEKAGVKDRFELALHGRRITGEDFKAERSPLNMPV